MLLPKINSVWTGLGRLNGLCVSLPDNSELFSLCKITQGKWVFVRNLARVGLLDVSVSAVKNSVNKCLLKANLTAFFNNKRTLKSVNRRLFFSLSSVIAVGL